jgi:hypothetical protein
VTDGVTTLLLDPTPLARRAYLEADLHREWVVLTVGERMSRPPDESAAGAHGVPGAGVWRHLVSSGKLPVT